MTVRERNEQRSIEQPYREQQKGVPPRQRLHQSDAHGQCDADRHPAHGYERRKVPGEADDSATNGIVADRRRDPADDRNAEHPVGQRRAGRQHVGAAPGQPDEPHCPDAEGVREQHQVIGPVGEVSVDVRRRGTDAGPRWSSRHCFWPESRGVVRRLSARCCETMVTAHQC